MNWQNPAGKRNSMENTRINTINDGKGSKEGSGLDLVDFLRLYLSLDKENRLAVKKLLKDGGDNND